MLKDRLREARKAANMKQKEVAAAVGITESTYCGYETGKRQPDPIKIAAIAAALGVSGDYLLETGFEDIKKEPTTATGSGLDEHLVMQLMSLSPDEVEKVCAFVQGLIAARPAEPSPPPSDRQ